MNPSRVTALLGPTNTGKTYRAIERMLTHPSGMFGLPLRLLAREVYDKVVAAKGRDRVALVTGEEKIVPSGARYFVCTVEAMPLDRRVAFVAVDEVQLAGDRQRGHVFTDRILHCRGLVETIFLGSDSMEWLLTELIPDLRVERADRMSSLRMAGPHRLSAVPARSAVVAFSAARVYELAERLKAIHGGAAVVLGALSPRTRNAQVELYQSGEVKHLVATDAIGMGLNLDLHHVCFSALRKYDGRKNRDLSPAEVAQIAGRAGRYKTPGSFGTLRPIELSAELVRAVEGHRFASVRRVFWRNRHLDFSGIDGLLASLERAPGHSALIGIRGEDDSHALATLARHPSIPALLDGPDSVRRLWEVCQVPDFRKTLTESHVHLLTELATHLLGPQAVLPEDWVAARIARLDQTGGELDTLMGRIAWIRTWTYITYRRDWVADPGHWQERTRAIEDRLSDALHQALVARFVESRASWEVDTAPLRLDGPDVWLGERLAGRLEGFEFIGSGALLPAMMGRVRMALSAGITERVDAVEGAESSEFSLDSEHRVLWRGGVIARLVAGPDLREPQVVPLRLALLSGPQKNRVIARVERWVQGTVATLLDPIRRHRTGPGVVRGLLYRLEAGLGTVERSVVEAEVLGLSEEQRKQLARYGVRVGQHSLFIPRLLKPDKVRVRARLYSVFHGIRPNIRAPDPSRSAVRADGPAGFWAAIGSVVAGELAVRADVHEMVAAELRRAGRRGAFRVPASVRDRLACDPGALHGYVESLGYRLVGESLYRAS